MKTEQDGTRDYYPVPTNMGDLYKLATLLVDAHGTLKEVELVKSGDITFLSPRP